jgi:hypothetical protein
MNVEYTVYKKFASSPFFFQWGWQTEIHSVSVKNKGGRSANLLVSLITNPQIHKFADSQNYLNLWTFRKCGKLQVCNSQAQSYYAICDLREKILQTFKTSENT